MFALIITIISIALVAALAIASIYYGGTAFSQGTAQAQASTIVNQAQQIGAGVTLYENDNSGATPAALTDLSPSYLQALPTPPSSATGAYSLSGSSVDVSVTQSNVCLAIDQSTDPTATSISSSASSSLQYQCFGSSSPYTFQYNVG